MGPADTSGMPRSITAPSRVTFGAAGAFFMLLLMALGGAPVWAVGFALALAALLLLRTVDGPAIRPLAFAAGGALSLLLVLVLVFAGPSLVDRAHRQRFDAPAWGGWVATDAGYSPRLAMVDDLLRRTDFRGWERSRLVTLLGEPDETRSDPDIELQYVLGPARRDFFGIDVEYLVFTLDAHGRVRSARILED